MRLQQHPVIHVMTQKDKNCSVFLDCFYSQACSWSLGLAWLVCPSTLGLILWNIWLVQEA